MTALWDEIDLERYDSPDEPHRPSVGEGRHRSDETSTSDDYSGRHYQGGYPVGDRVNRPHRDDGWWPSR